MTLYAYLRELRERESAAEPTPCPFFLTDEQVAAVDDTADIEQVEVA